MKAEKDEYDCLDCADTVRVGNPIEKIIAEELPNNSIKNEAEAIIEEVQIEDISDQVEQIEDFGTYVAPDEFISNGTEKSPETLKKKKRSYIEFRKDYRG